MLINKNLIWKVYLKCLCDKYINMLVIFDRQYLYSWYFKVDNIGCQKLFFKIIVLGILIMFFFLFNRCFNMYVLVIDVWCE